MALLSTIMGFLDRFLSPTMRKMEPDDLSRARFLVFSILFALPCNFFPCILHVIHDGSYSIWIYESLLNVFVAIALLRHLRRAPGYLLATRIFLLWIHGLLIFALVVMPAVYSLVPFWSPCLIVVSSLIFGLQGATLSALVLTTAWIGNLFWRYIDRASWISAEFGPFSEQMVLHLLGSSLFMAIVTGVYEFLREASYNKQAQQRLLAARHAHTGAVGELVGHVAHEVNNPLAILQGSAARLRRQLERNEWTHEAQKLLGNMQRGHERIIRVQQSLAVFSWGNQHEPFVTSDVRTLFRDVLLAMKPQAQVQQIHLDFMDRSANSTLRCQPHQIVYVLCSLIQNALDACRDLENARIMVEAKRDGETLFFSVHDNGKGIGEDVQDRIFQPFFTTKTGGNAQGLSLSVSRGILAEHGGEIRFHSQSGSTTFICQVPRDGMPVTKQYRKGA